MERTGSKQSIRKGSQTKTADAPATGKELPPGASAAPITIELPEEMTVRDLARALRTNPIEVIKELMANGVVASINQTIDYETAEIVAGELGFQTIPIQIEPPEQEEDEVAPSFQTLWQ